MTTSLLDLGKARQDSADNLPDLQAYLTQLVGELFRFARVSYGDELTLHFGDLRTARSPKLKNKPYGTFILGVRGSPWLIKSGSKPLALTAGINLENLPHGLGKPIRKEEIEANPLIQVGSRVLSVTPFTVKPVNAFGLELRVSDGSSFLILPTASDQDPDEEEIPEAEIADWELSSFQGVISAGPGLNWSFKPSSASETN